MTTTSATSSSTASTASTTSTASSTSAATSATVGQQILTSLGVTSGSSLSSLAPAIAKAQYASQTDALNTQLSKVQLQISEAGQLKSDLLTFQSSLSNLIDGGNLLPSPTVTNASVASASLPLGSSGSPSSYSLEVTQLAQPQVLASATSASTDTMQGGTLTFNFGTISGSSFTADSTHAASTITIPDGATLSQVASAINGAAMGVTAYVATNANGSQLVLKGTQGAADGFTITSSGTGTAGTTSLSTLAYDPSTTGSYTVAQSATDAAYKLDGIARTSTTNDITNAAPGLSLKLTGTNAGNPTTVSYSDPSSGITTAMQNITAVLNQIVGDMNTDMSTSSGGLYNDSGAKAMASKFSQLTNMVIMPNAASGAPKTLSDLGLAINKDGTYTLDTTKLATVLSTNANDVAAMFTKGVNGIYGTVNSMVSALTTSTDPGSLTGSVTRYTTLQSSLTAQQTALATQQSSLQDRLVAQYAATDATVATYNSTLTYLKAQIAAWNNTNNNG
ncbi:MAG: flagellar filament capping protein FliD [Sphingomonadales bacterium]|nr:flagellar filament capping protein FliD [Sphingomonadales bacterium]MDE2168891.1 flagellar filament capping protein FliD [Sphingomonadales bacterium]